MDEARRFRFLIPPFFLAMSLAAGLYFSDFNVDQALRPYSTEQLVGFGAVIAASILPVGFFLTSLSILGLHMSFWAFGFKTIGAMNGLFAQQHEATAKLTKKSNRTSR